jgi:intergrase/recombinase
VQDKFVWGVAGPLGFEPRIPGSGGLTALTRVQTLKIGLNWRSLRSGFVQYLQSQSYSARYIIDILHYLDLYVEVIDCPQDILGVFSRVQKGKRHVWLGLRVLFNYLEALGYDTQVVNVFRKTLPKVNKCGYDLKVPTEAEIISSLGKLIRL